MLSSTIRRFITYVLTHASTSECRILQALVFDADTDRRNATCDSCGGRIGGPRLYCLDCHIKSTELYNTLDLCCAPQCATARVTRDDLEGAHEPSHRLVKARASVLTRSHGRVHAAACDAFERVEETRRKIAELTSHPDEETEQDKQKTSSLEPSSTEMPAMTHKPDDVLNPPDGPKGGALPACGKCKGRLSFPFWYCILCEGWSRR